MKVPLSWLKEYVKIELSAEELAHKLTMAGVEVSGVQLIGGWNNVFVGFVKSIAPHPNADRLSLATVELPGEVHTVICGAPNINTGQKIAFAKEGAILFNSHTGEQQPLKKATIRGIDSTGMICSALELSLGTDHAGILVLNEDAPLGMALSDYLGDTILELDPTPNRSDCFSMLGIAHEVAAIEGTYVREPEQEYIESNEPIEDKIHVDIVDQNLCSRYTASLISEVKIGPSPIWLQERLTKAGQRPINNVVDITNYVMLEYGQPLHAFDYKELTDHRIIVRPAKNGEVLTTLDNIRRKLSPPILTISDSTKAIGLAGIMGGITNEIKNSTTEILLESANFSGPNTRLSSTVLKLRTEASLRFEKGLRPELAEKALRRATQLIAKFANGKVSQGIIDIYPTKKEVPAITLTSYRVNQILGINFDIKEMKNTLISLGFAIMNETRDSLSVKVPYWRSDIHIEDDLVEEVARIIGYDRIPTVSMSTSIPLMESWHLIEFKENIKDLLVASGLQETISYSLTSRENLEKAQVIIPGIEPLRLANPMSKELEYLRPSLRASILSTLAYNLRHKEETVKIFEIGRIYSSIPGELPDEREIAICALTGKRFPQSWKSSQPIIDFYDAKGVVQVIFDNLGLKPSFELTENDALLHPGKSAIITHDGVQLGTIGEIHPRILDRFEIDISPVAFIEFYLDTVLKFSRYKPQQFHDFSKFPASSRDLAIIIDSNIVTEQIKKVILSENLVTDATIFDVYEGKGVAIGKKSLAYRINFQSSVLTLTADQVNKSLEAIITKLQRIFGAQLRV